MEYNKSNPLKVITLFSGYDSQALALDRIKEYYPDFDYELVAWCEIEKNACIAHDALYPQYKDRNIGDITKVNPSTLPDCDLVTWSFPCFVAGTLVLTNEGYKPIEDVKVGDYVLTHTNTFKKVTKVSAKPYNGTMVKLWGMGTDIIYCTAEHPFYVRRMYKKGHEGDRCFHEPEWIKAKNLDKNTYLGYAINTKEEMPIWEYEYNHIEKTKDHVRVKDLLNKKAFWYLMGRYVGDGWKREGNGKGIVICCSDRNRKSLEDTYNELGIHYCVVNERTVYKTHVSMCELYAFVERYGYYAHGKKIDAETLNLPKDLLEGFMEGYLDSDGYFNGMQYKTSSVSRELCFGIAQCVAKVYHRPFSIYRTARPPQTKIEGRVVNQKDTYTVAWKITSDKQDKAFYEDGYIWYPLSKLPIFQKDSVEVYNMSVEDDESYTANGAIVHNCTDISAAGRQEGLSKGSGTRSSLAWDAIRIFEVKKPKYLLMENVAALLSQKFLGDFHEINTALERMGYTNFTQILDASKYGIPQHRERVFMVSILRTEEEQEPRFYFPKPMPLTKRLKDVLEDKVDEKYYLSEKAIEGFMRTDADKSHCHNFTPKTEEDMAFTVRCKAGTRVDDNFIKE